jgi:hypothetical protein
MNSETTRYRHDHDEGQKCEKLKAKNKKLKKLHTTQLKA